MTGLERIIERITADSEIAVKNIINSAETEADKIISEAEEKATADAAEIIRNAEKKAGIIIERAISSADAERRRSVLLKKQEIISDIISEAKKRLKELPDEEYFSVVEKLIATYKIRGGGEVIFSAADKKRLPEGFDAKGMTVSEKNGEFDCGFILDYGNIEVNCTFDALFAGKYDELSDIVNGIVFGSNKAEGL